MENTENKTDVNFENICKISSKIFEIAKKKLAGEKVKIDEATKTITVKPEVKAQDILDAFGGTAKIVKSDGSYLENVQSIIGTGYIVEDIYTITKKGDPNGDGKIDSADLLSVQKHLLNVTALKEANLKAGDANSDNKIDSADLLKIQKYLLGVSDIEV